MISSQTIRIIYVKNKLSLGACSKEESISIRKLWETLREDYNDWVANLRMEDFGSGKPVAEYFIWKGMSSWWLNPLVRKDTEILNKWLHRLMVVYICKSYGYKLFLETDDRILFNTLKNNFSEISVKYQKPKVKSVREFLEFYLNPFFKTLLLINSLFNHLKIKIVLLGFRKKQISKYANLEPSVWFRSTYPANWIQDAEGSLFDRNILNSPVTGKNYGQNPRYLLFYQLYNRDKYSGILKLRNELKKLTFNKEAVFVQAHLSFIDIFSVYLQTFIELIRFLRLRKYDRFKELFKINGINVAPILIEEWINGYFGSIQFNKIHGMAYANWLKGMKYPHTIVTYGENFVQSRSLYHLCNEISPFSKFVAFQHAINVKNKMGSYDRAIEFNYNAMNHVNFSPAPDYFLTQGSQFSDILKEYFPENKIQIIGSLKYDNYLKILKKKEQIAHLCNQKLKINKSKVLLLAPSVNDSQEIIDIFSHWRNRDDWMVVLSPHPAVSIKTIKMYQEKLYPWLKIHYESSMRTYELMTASTLVISGYSTTAIEASFYGIQSVRFAGLGTFPLFEYENNIPVFYDGQSFIEWFEEKDWESNEYSAFKKDADKMISKYFYKIDGKSSIRLWDFLNTQPDLPHN